MQVSVVQMNATADKAENMAAIERLVPQAAIGADLVVLPEAVMREFGKPDEPLVGDAEPLDGPFVTLLQQLAGAHEVTVVAGMFEQTDEPGRVFNTLVAVTGDGLRVRYRKTHLYDSFGYQESALLVAADPEAVTLPLGDLTLGLMTCYDLRFPEMARALVDAGADTLVIPAAWVAGSHKVDHWRTLLTARAIENTCHVVAANQNGRTCTGHSAIIDPMGVTRAGMGVEEGFATAAITRDDISAARKRNPALQHRRFAVTATPQRSLP